MTLVFGIVKRATFVVFLTGVAVPLWAAESSAPSTSSKILRALGVQTAPGARGDKAYHKAQYEEALRQYGHAVEETDTAAPARRLLDLNIGNALYRQQRYPEAVEYYGQALKRAGRDSGFASRGHHNLGNTHFRKGQAAAQADSTNLQPAIADLREAVAHYKKALRLNPKARPTKQNLEMAGSLLNQLIARQEQQQQQKQQGEPPPPPEPSALAKEALARALQLAGQRRYADAHAVLTDIMRRDKTAATFAAHQQRLDDVMKILRGEQPDDPKPRDPRATPWKPTAPGGRRAP
jgi:tetratricopeptide (TPR) repeat protein